MHHPPPRAPRRLAWAAVAGVALAVRLLNLAALRGTPVFDHLVGDARTYDAWAQEIARGSWLGTEVFYQAPLYPYALAVIYAVAGRSLLLVRVLQALLGAAGCVLLGVAGTRVFGGRAGLLAALLLAIWPSAIFADGLVQKSALDVFLVCALLATVTGAAGDPRPARWLAPGAVLGALCLTRENALAFLPVLGIFAWSRGHARAAACLGLGCALVLAPVAVRNRVVGGELHLTTAQFGPNFYIGNNALATGMYRPLRYGRGDARYERLDATELAEQAAGHPLGPREVSGYWTGRALAFITTAPGAWARLLARKALLFVNRVELGDAEDLYTYGDWSRVLALLTPLLGFGVLVPLAAAGIVLVWGRTRAVGLLVALLLVYALTVIATFVTGRYRHPVLPLLLLFAAAAVTRARAVEGRRRIAAALAATCLVVPANWPVVTEASVRAATLYNLGRVLQDDPDGHAAAVTYYRRALALDPALALAHNNLGLLLEQDGRLDDAVAELRAAVALEPAQADYPYNLGHAEAARGDLAAAADAYARALALDPRHTAAHTNLGALLQQRGDLAGAVRHYQAALAVDPRQADALNDLGTAYAAQGRLDDAIRSFQAALAVAPQATSARENLARALADAARRD